jgi:hypothetical protein
MSMSNKNRNKCPQPSYSCNASNYAFKGRPKKDNSKLKMIYFINCRSCGKEIILEGITEVIEINVIVRIAHNYETI